MPGPMETKGKTLTDVIHTKVSPSGFLDVLYFEVANFILSDL